MEGGNSRDTTYEDVCGITPKIRWDELKTPVFWHRGYVSLREIQGQNWRAIVPVRIRFPSDSNNSALFASRI